MIDQRDAIGRVSRGLLSLAATALLVLLVLTGCDVVASPTFGSTTVGTDASNTVTTIPIQITRGQDNSTDVQVPVYFNDEGPYSFVLDTGASISLIDQHLANRLGLQPSGEEHPVVGVGGTEQVSMVQVSNWRAGTAALPATSIGAGVVPSDQGTNGFVGLLGSDIWSQFGKITIDYSASTLTLYASLKAHAAHSAPAPRALLWEIWRRAE